MLSTALACEPKVGRRGQRIVRPTRVSLQLFRASRGAPAARSHVVWQAGAVDPTSHARQLASCDLVIFDCDGVLVDSEPAGNRVLQRLLAAEGLSLSLPEMFETFMGHSIPTCIEIASARLGRDLGPDFEQRLERAFIETLSREVAPMPGVVQALDALPMSYCVASSGSHAKIRASLGSAGLLSRFEGHIFSAADVPRPKPAPDIFLHAAAAHAVPPSACCVVEDTAIGVRAAVAAGMRVYGFAHQTPPGVLATAGADDCLADLSRLPHRIEALGLRLLPAQAHDVSALAELRVAAMRDSLERVGRFDPQRARARVLARFDPDQTRVLDLGGRLVGFLMTEARDREIYLAQLHVHPSFQNRGLGSRALRSLLSEADSAQRAVRVSALRESAANRFYLYHGFELVSETEFDLHYVRTPSLRAPAQTGHSPTGTRERAS